MIQSILFKGGKRVDCINIEALKSMIQATALIVNVILVLIKGDDFDRQENIVFYILIFLNSLGILL